MIIEGKPYWRLNKKTGKYEQVIPQVDMCGGDPRSIAPMAHPFKGQFPKVKKKRKGQHKTKKK